MTIYRSALISRRDGVTKQEFRDHWISIHGALASKLPGVGRYWQNHIVERFYEKLEAPLQDIDGISQLAFDSVAAMEISDASDEYAAVKRDIPNFQGAITILVLDRVDVVAPLSDDFESGVKLLWLSTRRTAEADPALRAHWLGQAADGASRVPGILRCVQNFVIDRSHPVHAGVPAGDASKLEAITEMWFKNFEALVSGLESAEGKKFVYENEHLKAMAVYRIEEVHIIR